MFLVRIASPIPRRQNLATNRWAGFHSSRFFDSATGDVASLTLPTFRLRVRSAFTFSRTLMGGDHAALR